MGWGGWTRKPAAVVTSAIGLDVNSTRVRAVVGPSWEGVPTVLPLAALDDELPLAISCQDRTPTVGWPAYHLCRLLPHVLRRNYLIELGRQRDGSIQEKRLPAADAVALVADTVRRALPTGQPLGIVVPPYLTAIQTASLNGSFAEAGLQVAGSAAVPLALSASDGTPFGTALVLDADEHALTWSVVVTEGQNARLLACHSVTGARVGAWFDRLIDGVSDRCIRLCRRDPRDSAAAEQALFEQLDAALSSARTVPQVTLNLRTSHWFQEMKLTPDEFESMTTPLVRIAMDGMRQAVAEAHAAAPVMARPELLWVTAEAARLPGLVAAATQHIPESTVVQSLRAEALAVAAHVLAGHWLRGDLGGGYVGAAVPRFAHNQRSQKLPIADFGFRILQSAIRNRKSEMPSIRNPQWQVSL
jgi:hypothetical protein